MPGLLRNVATLIAALTILQLAGGLLGVRLPLAVSADHLSNTSLGLIAASYSAGFMMGATICTTLLARVGHIRVYAACAAIFAAATLALHFTHTVWTWGVVRMVAGLVVALMFATIESWLASAISKNVRGEVLSVYMVMTKGALALGPFLAFGYDPRSAEPWMIAAGIAALSMLPVCFTTAEQPAAPKAQPLALVEQFATAPAAVIASFGAGLVNAGVLTLAPLYASQHYGPGAATEFYSAAWIGSLILQWPAGKLSDRIDRRVVIAMLTGGAAASALALAIFGGAAPKNVAVFIFFLWGACALSFYGLAVAHMADRAEPHKLAQSASGLLFVWAAGSIIGPIVQGPTVDIFGIEGVFWFAGVAALLVALAMFWRRTTRASAPAATKAEVAPVIAGSVAGADIAYGGEDETRLRPQ